MACRFVLFTFLCVSLSVAFSQDYYQELDNIYNVLDDIRLNAELSYWPDWSDTANNTLNTYDVLRTTIHTDLSSIDTYLRGSHNTKLQGIINAVQSLDGNQTANWSLLMNELLYFDRLLSSFARNNTNVLNDISDFLDTLNSSPLSVSVTNSISLAPSVLANLQVSVTNDLSLSVTNHVITTLDQQDPTNEWLSHWRNDQWKTLQFLTNSLPALITNSASATAISAASISNLVDNWSSIYTVPGWQSSGVGLSLEGFLSEFLSEWNRNFYTQAPIAGLPPALAPWGGDPLLNWFGISSFFQGPEENNGRFAFSDWLANALWFIHSNSSNMVVESFEPYSTSDQAAGNNQYDPDWNTNLTSSSYSRPELEAVDTTGVETELSGFDANVSEAFGKLDTSSMAGTTSLRIIPHFSAGGIEVDEKSFDFSENAVASAYALSVGRVMVLVWNVIGLCLAFRIFNDFWSAFTQL